jgi:hypothetical protein
MKFIGNILRDFPKAIKVQNMKSIPLDSLGEGKKGGNQDSYHGAIRTNATFP